MGTNDLAIRFTEETYATKSEVSRELRMSLIDNIWSNILKYRSNYYRYLSLKSIDKSQFMVCYCQLISGLVNSMDSKLVRLMGEYVAINKNNGSLSHFEDMCIISCLRSVSKKRGIDISDIHLRSLIQGDLKDVSLDKRIIRRYLKGIYYVKNHHTHQLDIDYLAGLYSAFTENPELTSFYREVEDKNPNNRVLIDRVYTAAPVNLIEGLMNTLFNFLTTSSLSSVVKAIITYYFFNYIRPFPNDNEEIALLMMKSVLANASIFEFGAIVPFENILTVKEDEMNRICTEVQRTNDLTYFINFILKEMNASLEDLANIKATYTSEEVRKDFYREDNVAKGPANVQKVEKIEEEVTEEVPAEPVIQPKEPATDINRPFIKDFEDAPAREEPVNKPAPVVPPVIESPKPVSHELAFSYIPEVLDEKAAARLEEHLLEMDPALKKGEAYFYARHCTMHMNYTIAQYKKALGCAYETARTSMEHLVELHYYQKNQIKNKFVYTPIKR